jgi:hypothetical protein
VHAVVGHACQQSVSLGLDLRQCNLNEQGLDTPLAEGLGKLTVDALFLSGVLE